MNDYSVPNHEDVICSSCQRHCIISNRNKTSTDDCPIQKISLWPLRNKFMLTGILSMIAERYEGFFWRGCVFIDFSTVNLKYFTNESWLEILKNINMALVIISDSYMEPLATYWRKKEKRINYIVHLDGDRNTLVKKLNSFHLGVKRAEKRNSRVLNDQEVKFLELATKGHSLKSISEELLLDAKRTYRVKESIQRKMGVKLTSLLTR